MAALERLLSRTRFHCFSSPLLRSYSSPNSSFPWLHRSLCSSSSPLPPDPTSSSPPPNESNRNKPESVPLQPISYPIKPKDPSPPPQQQQQPLRSVERPEWNLQNSQPPEPRAWGREDMRFVKDFDPPVSPVSYQPRVDPQSSLESRDWSREDIRFVKDFNPSVYQQRVAPLPEDRPREEAGDGEDERRVAMEEERKKIEAENRVLRRVFRVDEQQNIPFPTLIKTDEQAKKGAKTVLDLKEAIKLLKANARRKFDETVEAHVKLAVDLRRTDLKLSGSMSLPHGSGKSLRVAVFAEGAAADEARAAGADLVGGEDLIEGIKNGTVSIKEIDKCIAVPKLMPRIGKEISKKLSRLTPNARDGSVTTDISRAVKDAKKNIKFKKDKSAIVHVGLGKVSFTEEALCENVGAFLNALLLAKPAGLKKSSKYAGYVSTFHICSTMGPSFPVSIQSLSIAADRYNKLQVR